MKYKMVARSVSLFVAYNVLLLVICLYPRRISINSETTTPKIEIPLEVGVTQTPKEGENVKVANEAAVYLIENQARRKYPSATAYLAENPPFDTPYDSGGILIIAPLVANKIPLGQPMPDVYVWQEMASKKPIWQWEIWSSLFRSDKAGHLLGYLVWGSLFLLVLQTQTDYTDRKKWWLLFIVGTGLGGTIELLQATFTASRAAEWLDLFANTVGLWLSWKFYQWWSKRMNV